MPPSRSIPQHVADHLGQAEFSLKVAANFDCLKGTPAHDAVRAALARVDEAKIWVQRNLPAEHTAAHLAAPVTLAGREGHRIVRRRMARLAP